MIHMPKWQMPIWQCCIMIHVKIGGLGKLGNLGKIGKIGKMCSQRKLGVSENTVVLAYPTTPRECIILRHA